MYQEKNATCPFVGVPYRRHSWLERTHDCGSLSCNWFSFEGNLILGFAEGLAPKKGFLWDSPCIQWIGQSENPKRPATKQTQGARNGDWSPSGLLPPISWGSQPKKLGPCWWFWSIYNGFKVGLAALVYIYGIYGLCWWYNYCLMACIKWINM